MTDKNFEQAVATLSDVAKIKDAGDRLLDHEISDSNLSLTNTKLRVKERRNGRMQLRFNLDKDEAQGFKNFMTMVKPPEVSEEIFIKSCFLQGIKAMQEELAGLVKKYAQANPEELEELGVEVVEGEDGQIKVEEIQQSEKE